MARAKGASLVGAVKWLRQSRESAREMCGILLGYTTEMFVMAELKDPVVRKTAGRLDGAPRCAWQCTWQADPIAAPAASR